MIPSFVKLIAALNRCVICFSVWGQRGLSRIFFGEMFHFLGIGYAEECDVADSRLCPCFSHVRKHVEKSWSLLRARAHTHTHSHTLSHTRTHARTHSHARSCTHSRSHARTHTHTHTHTHRQTERESHLPCNTGRIIRHAQ